jgi:hypothetical protein
MESFIRGPNIGETGKTCKFSVRHFLLQGAALFGGNFNGAREPAGEGAVQERVAHEKHEDDGQERDGDCADHNFGSQASAELLAAALGPQAEDGAGNN